MHAMQQAFPNPPSIQIHRIIGSGDMYVVMGRPDNVVEFRDGRISRETRSYGSPFEPPQWRAQWVERTRISRR